MEKEKVSIIIPFYNSIDTIEKTIISCVNQTYKNIEIILVDDGSENSPSFILKKYPQVKIIYQNNRGPFEARKHGFQKSSGQFVTFVDADDELSPIFVETLLSHLKKYRVPLAQCSVSKTPYLDSKVTQQPILFSNIEDIFIDYANIKNLKPYMHSKLYARFVLNSFFQIANPKNNKVEDVKTMHICFWIAKQCVCIKEKLYFYRQLPNSRNNNCEKNFKVKTDDLNARIDQYNFIKRNIGKKVSEISILNTCKIISSLMIQFKVYKTEEFKIVKCIYFKNVSLKHKRLNLIVMFTVPRIYSILKNKNAHNNFTK